MTVVGNRLSDMEFDEVSLVNRPANQLSKVVLFKSADSEERAVPGHKNKKMDEDEEEISKPGHYHKMEDDEEEDEDEEEVSKPGHKMKKGDADVIDLPSEVYEYIDALESANAEMVDELSKMAEYIEEETDILKSADPAIVEIVKAAEQRAEAAEQIAKAERDYRIEQEFIAKAAEFNALSVDASTLGPILKAAAEALSEEAFGVIIDALTAANETVSESDLFSEVGKSTSFEGGSSSDSIEKAAARLREEDTSLSHAQAISKAVELDPSLYTEYLRGN